MRKNYDDNGSDNDELPCVVVAVAASFSFFKKKVLSRRKSWMGWMGEEMKW